MSETAETEATSTTITIPLLAAALENAVRHFSVVPGVRGVQVHFRRRDETIIVHAFGGRPSDPAAQEAFDLEVDKQSSAVFRFLKNWVTIKDVSVRHLNAAPSPVQGGLLHVFPTALKPAPTTPEVRYWHVRLADEDGHPSTPIGTIAYVENGEAIVYGLARCSSSDMFSRSEGRSIARQRLDTALEALRATDGSKDVRLSTWAGIKAKDAFADIIKQIQTLSPRAAHAAFEELANLRDKSRVKKKARPITTRTIFEVRTRTLKAGMLPASPETEKLLAEKAQAHTAGGGFLVERPGLPPVRVGLDQGI